jgi:uncharacterized protein (DUF427 family)
MNLNESLVALTSDRRVMARPQRQDLKPGQESVWDYPRPPRLEPCSKRVQVQFKGRWIADSQSTLRVLETSHPPVYYIPPQDIQQQYLHSMTGNSFCEWKGVATYYTLTVPCSQDLGEDGGTVEQAAWTYLSPTPTFAAIQGYVAFYPSKMDACYVDGELVKAQPGDFYGGWITQNIVGPFKGSPGTWGW